MLDFLHVKLYVGMIEEMAMMQQKQERNANLYACIICVEIQTAYP